MSHVLFAILMATTAPAKPLPTAGNVPAPVAPVGIAAPVALDVRQMSDADLFRKGVTTYSQAKSIGDYQRAALFFTTLAERGIKHEELYYNLGNSYYMAGQFGYAVFNFERALKLYPGHTNARYNLNLARKVIQTRFKDSVVSFGEDPLWIKIVTWLHLNTLLIFFFAFWVLLFSLLMSLLFLRRGLIRIAAVTSAVIIGVIAGSFGLILSGRTYYDNAFQYGIVLNDEIKVRVAPQTAANTSFTLHAGLRVRLGSEESAWIKISLPNGMEGWVEKVQVGRF
ncbi:tetratricopeptide repeat protein [Myxococcota bacterium]|nr:tetratricopeptide repeat protein [Myxococcota bacterium]